MISTLIGLDLEKFIKKDGKPPAKTLTEDPSKTNPEYLTWFRQDQILISAILGSCSETIQPTISSAETTLQAWERLNASYTSASRSQIISLKSRLAKNPKGNRTVTEFLQDMKSIADDPALAQSDTTDEDLTMKILSNLGDDYKSIIAVIKIRETPMSYPELFDKLVDYERSLKEAETAPAIATVNYTQRHPASRTQTRSFNDPRFSRSNNMQPKPNRSQWSPNYQSGGTRTNRNPTYCHYCNIPGHETKDCRKLAQFLKEYNVSVNPPTNPIANTTMARTTAPTPAWMFDTGASHHVTADRSSLHTMSEYGGPDEIVLGNGKTLSISHVGHSKLPTSTRTLSLNNVLYVPTLRNNLVASRP